MSLQFFIYCPRGNSAPARVVLEGSLNVFLGQAGYADCMSSGITSYSLHVEMIAGEDPKLWTLRLREFLRQEQVSSGSYFDVHPPYWKPGISYERIFVYDNPDAVD